MGEYDVHNPFDRTIWDPVDPEQAIEDSFHGPEAILGLLAIPPFKNEDGTFYVFGASNLPCRTCNFDSLGRPFVEIKVGGMSNGFMKELEEHRKWIEGFHAGELPERDDLDYPEFQLAAPPYIKMQDNA